MERIERLVRRPRGRGPHLKAFTADERALFMKIEARVAAGETEHAAVRLELGLVYEDALGNYPGRVKAVVQRLRDWRAWEAECRGGCRGKAGGAPPLRGLRHLTQLFDRSDMG